MRLSILSKFFLFLFVLISSYSWSQDLSKYNHEKERLTREIELTDKLLNETKVQQTNAIQSVVLLKSQISSRQQLIASYKTQINFVNNQISSSDSTISQMSRNIDISKLEYIQLIQDAYLRRHSFDFATYILSSESFNQAYQRYRMINEINSYRKAQVSLLSQSSLVLKAEREKLVYLKSQLNELLNNLTTQSVSLQREKNLVQKSISDLQGKEKKLLSELKAKKKQQEELENKIVELIRELSSSKSKSVPSSEFDKNKGKLIWPVSSGVVVSLFGEHEHPVLKGVMVKNNGVDFRVSSSGLASCVFAGEVSRVVAIPGYNKAVIVRHGKFLTVYANLAEVNVKTGQKLSTGDKVGSIFFGDGDNSGILHFEIWNESVKVNPSEWIKK